MSGVSRRKAGMAREWGKDGLLLVAAWALALTVLCFVTPSVNGVDWVN